MTNFRNLGNFFVRQSISLQMPTAFKMRFSRLKKQFYATLDRKRMCAHLSKWTKS